MVLHVEGDQKPHRILECKNWLHLGTSNLVIKRHLLTSQEKNNCKEGLSLIDEEAKNFLGIVNG